MTFLFAALLAGSSALAADAPAPANPALSPLDALYPELETLYRDLHQNPELSNQEVQTAAKLAAKLEALAYDVTTGVGGTGVVAVMKNGKGPTVLLRADMDALPVEEKTGLPYASKATAKNAAGETVPVMHACGHDVHMTSWIGAATLLARAKDRWTGTLVLVGQPAEEGGGGARKMLDDGFLTRFPKPAFALSMHDSAVLPAGQIGMTPGYAFANVDSVDITIYGRGGHGSKPEATIDPIVIAARTVLALQAIVARENSPFDPAVVTVGSIHGGLKHNIIPDEVKLQLTVRSYKEEVRRRILAAIERIAKTEAAVSNAPKEPTVTVSEGTNALYNDPDLSRRLTLAYVAAFGKDRVTEARPVMAGEDFGEFGRAAKAPSVLVWIGAVDGKKFAEAKGNEATLPYLHSSLFAPDPEPTVKAGAAAMTVGALELLGKP